MAFSKANLTIVKDNFNGKTKIWSYVSGDDYTASNYFDPVINVLAKGDIILAGNTTSTETVDILLVTSVTTHVTVTATAAS